MYFFQSKLSWSWPRRHRAPAVASSCPSRSVRRTPALQPQSACIICLHHATPRHADAQGLAPSAGATRLRRSAPRRGLGIFGTWPCARVVGLLNVSGGNAPPRGTFAQRPWSWSGRGLKSPSRESWQPWNLALCFFECQIQGGPGSFFGDFDSIFYRRNWFPENWPSIPPSAIRLTIRFGTIRVLRGVWALVSDSWLISIR